MIIDIIQSEKIDSYNLNLTKSQFKAFQTALAIDIPIKLFLFLLDEKQKKSL
jgi:hypothetical protein